MSGECGCKVCDEECWEPEENSSPDPLAEEMADIYLYFLARVEYSEIALPLLALWLQEE